jgi:hypothetical protein
VFFRTMGALAGGVSVLIFLGCMSFSIGGRNYEAPSTDSRCEDLLTQKGQCPLKAHMEEVVYYPVPFGHVPNLELTNTDDACVVVEQKEDHFRVRNGSWDTVRVKWKARGIRVPAVAAPVPPPEPGPLLSPNLPAEPVPVERQPSPGPK